MASHAVPPYLLFVLDLLESEWPPPSNLHELFIKQELSKREWKIKKKETQQVTNTFDTRWNLVLTLNRVHSISPPCVFIDQGGKSRMFNLFDHLMGTVQFLGGANKWKKENTLIF